MRISEIFNLEKDQSQLDFVDIEVDLPLFLDPYFLSLRTDSWSVDAHRTTQSFFIMFLTCIEQEESKKQRIYL
ncbi:hypothetical protein [Bacillus siamensis]|uniref:hypothetical protein n=1 Tax=Bacillus siamensis TaxID=659243 RepID=UPI001E2BF8B3|nr:hypothetical protein [Bacillus siamensis]